ncbi:hypothetical protein CbuD7D7780_04020 [Coxiella burnetii]|uniref:Tetratricopeptide repeat family protein n=1 Tax=Coxiella burnetii (strain Dugway 5J108-111) TaxID=434922 RepID=A9KDV5_COXBN|nr:hypothetical protein [Coxiella burnetii]ABS77407.1 tetratricopeptide repeat family protein [Coxiella burnetii Dugway 5J108-111]OYK80536.1 hypothetical protein CbuD7E6568_04000 [Coxiella burnetii]OYK82621.1 hypothetical protein CbuD7D7780_04020 [Coxiella burnetii]
MRAELKAQLDEGFNLLKQNRPKEALSYIETCQASLRNTIEMKILEARCLQDLSQDVKTINLLSQIERERGFARLPFRQQHDVRFTLIKSYIKGNQYEEAEETFKRIPLNQYTLVTQLLHLEFDRVRGRLDKAEKRLFPLLLKIKNHEISQEKDIINVQIHHAHLLEDRGKISSARQLLTSLINDYPRNIRLQIIYFYSLLNYPLPEEKTNKNNVELAQRCLNQLHKLNVNKKKITQLETLLQCRREPHISPAQVQSTLNLIRDSKEDELSPANLLRIGQHLLDTQNHAAFEIARVLVEKFGSLDHHILFVQSCLMLKKYQEAIPSIQFLMEEKNEELLSESQRITNLSSMGECAFHLKIGELRNKAEEQFRKLIDKLERTQDTELLPFAKTAYLRFLEKSPDQNKNWAALETEYQLIEQRFPTYWAAYLNHGWILVNRLNEYEQGIGVLSILTSAWEKNGAQPPTSRQASQTFNLMAIAAYHLNELDKQRKYAEKAIQADSTYVRAYSTKAHAYCPRKTSFKPKTRGLYQKERDLFMKSHGYSENKRTDLPCVLTKPELPVTEKKQNTIKTAHKKPAKKKEKSKESGDSAATIGANLFELLTDESLIEYNSPAATQPGKFPLKNRKKPAPQKTISQTKSKPMKIKKKPKSVTSQSKPIRQNSPTAQRSPQIPESPSSNVAACKRFGIFATAAVATAVVTGYLLMPGKSS